MFGTQVMRGYFYAVLTLFSCVCEFGNFFAGICIPIVEGCVF